MIEAKTNISFLDTRSILEYFRDNYMKMHNKDSDMRGVTSCYNTAIKVLESEHYDTYILDEITLPEFNYTIEHLAQEYVYISTMFNNGNLSYLPAGREKSDIFIAFNVILTLLDKFKNIKMNEIKYGNRLYNVETMNEDDIPKKDITEEVKKHLEDYKKYHEFMDSEDEDTEDDNGFTKIYRIEFLEYADPEKTMIKAQDDSIIKVENPFLISEWEVPGFVSYGIKSLEFVGYMK